MLNLLLSPNGQIGSAAFKKAGYVLILLGVIPSLIQMVSPSIGKMLGILTVLLIYPWVCVWVKRLHASGKSGWGILLYILLYIFLTTIIVAIALALFGGGDFMGQFMGAATDQASGDISQAEYTAQVEALGKTVALPIVIASILGSLATLFLGDKLIGPATT